MRLINYDYSPVSCPLADFFDVKRSRTKFFISHDPSSKEYWVDLNQCNVSDQVDHIIKDKNATSIVFYDIFHADFRMNDQWVPFVKKTADRIPVEWITANHLPIQDFPTTHYDVYWNRCKSVYTNGPMGVRYKSNGLTFKHHALNWDPRSHQYLSPVRSNTSWREELLMFL